MKPPYSFTSGRPQPNSLGARLAVLPARTKETVCYECHADVRGQFNLPSHHPVPEGRMTCIQCHPPHKGSVRAVVRAHLPAGYEEAVKFAGEKGIRVPMGTGDPKREPRG